MGRFKKLGRIVKKAAPILKKVAPLAAIAAVGVVGGPAAMAAYKKFSPMAKGFMQNRRAAKRVEEQEQLYPSIGPPMQGYPLPAGRDSGTSYAARPRRGFWAMLFGGR